jgi:hypothetical protein
MNDDKLTAAVRQSVGGVHMSIPAEDIISRARTIRSRRRIPAATAALTVAAGAALAVTSVAAPGHPAPVQLAAWSVAKKPGGAVQVTIRELRDPEGLQRRMRADGVPVTVRFANKIPLRSQLPAGCLYYPLPFRQLERLTMRIFPQSTSAPAQTAFTVNPSALPARAGLWINVTPPTGHGPAGAVFSAAGRLVYASGRCPSGKTATGPADGIVIIGGISGAK